VLSPQCGAGLSGAPVVLVGGLAGGVGGFGVVPSSAGFLPPLVGDKSTLTTLIADGFTPLPNACASDSFTSWRTQALQPGSPMMAFLKPDTSTSNLTLA
jgi:hypothetical protein